MFLPLYKTHSMKEMNCAHDSPPKKYCKKEFRKAMLNSSKNQHFTSAGSSYFLGINYFVDLLLSLEASQGDNNQSNKL